MYNEKSCNALEKPYYTAIEAALRWCNLIAHEEKILDETKGHAIPPIGAFPQWPCLRTNAEKILDAMNCEVLPYCRDGRAVTPGEQVNVARRTARHADLKSWLSKNYPDQKPAFLFDEIERSTHAAITIEALQALQAERDALQSRLDKAERWFKEIGRNLESERDEWRDKFNAIANDPDIDSRERASFERLVYVLAREAKYKLTKPYADEELIQQFAASVGVKVPTGKGSIARKLEAAAARAAQDLNE